MASEEVKKLLLPQHVQQELCTSRLPYRQGRKLTAVKVYTINNESNHLLIFGVPSLNLRREAKSLFYKFGQLIQFNISTEHEAEDFTETYHAVYERIQSARVAKKMLDTKNFYGGILHVCYAPELETIDETRQKIKRRQIDVLNRLKNLKRETENAKTESQLVNNDKVVAYNTTTEIVNEVKDYNVKKLNMGEENTFDIATLNPVHRKRKNKSNVTTKKAKYLPINDSKPEVNDSNVNKSIEIPNSPSEVVDCTSIESEVITNINEHLNYNKFGNEVIVKLPQKPLNKIIFNFPNKNK